MSRLKPTLRLIATGLLLIGSSWYLSQMKPLIKLDTYTLSTTVDATITQLTVRQFNEEGQLSTLLTSPLMEHIPKKNVHLLSAPFIKIMQPNQPSWEISSRKARAVDGGQQITFIKDVVVHQKPGKDSVESTLKTEEVTYFPKEKKATTDRFVTFEQPGNTVESTGMNAYLDEKRVELLHGAKGSYAPNKNG
jgi:lipopolysaccharide export system protein LptC